MRRFTRIVMLASMALLACPLLVVAAEELDWAYPATPRPEPLDNLAFQRGLPGSPSVDQRLGRVGPHLRDHTLNISKFS